MCRKQLVGLVLFSRYTFGHPSPVRDLCLCPSLFISHFITLDTFAFLQVNLHVSVSVRVFPKTLFWGLQKKRSKKDQSFGSLIRIKRDIDLLKHLKQ